MDIEIGGIKLSKFISSFKQMYRLTDTTYDYMSYLEIADCASYCALKKQYNNPNDVLNSIITPYLNSINIVGEKIENIETLENDMKGGGGSVAGILLILSLYVCFLGSVYAGTATDSFYASYGRSTESWPRPTGDKPIEPKPTYAFLGLFWKIEPDRQALYQYATLKSQWEQQNGKYIAFEKAYEAMMEDSKGDRIAEQAQLNIEQTKANTEFVDVLGNKIIYTIIALGTLGFIGMIINLVSRNYFIGGRQLQELLAFAHAEGAREARAVDNGRQEIRHGNRQGRPEIEYGGSTSLTRRRGRWEGGRKTKNYKKKRTTTKRRR